MSNRKVIPFCLALAVSVASNASALASDLESKQTKQSENPNKVTAESPGQENVKLSQVPQNSPRQGYSRPVIQNPRDPFYSQYVRQAPPPILQPGQVLVSTTQAIPGFRVVSHKGIVRGDVVFGPTILQSFKSSLKAIIGGKIGGYTQMCQRARQNAFEDMLNQARQLGANAVIGIQYDSSTFSTSNDNDVGTEVFCYGTAVTVEPTRKLRV